MFHIKVKNCLNCPFNNLEFSICYHPNRENKDSHTFDEPSKKYYSTTKIPSRCPLKKDFVVIEVDKEEN